MSMILYERQGPVALVTLNRPEKLNAINAELQDELLAALDQAAADAAVHVAVVRGAGRAFCAGYDVTGSNDFTSDSASDRAWLERVLRGWLRIWDLPIPVIAQVHGHCLAGGTQLAAICDVGFVADTAVIGTPQLPLGAGYVAAFWAWFVGPKKAKEIFLPTGTTITAQDVTAMGLFNRVVPADRLADEVPDYAVQVARTPRDVLGLQKRPSTVHRRPWASARRSFRLPRSMRWPTRRSRCGRCTASSATTACGRQWRRSTRVSCTDRGARCLTAPSADGDGVARGSQPARQLEGRSHEQERPTSVGAAAAGKPRSRTSPRAPDPSAGSRRRWSDPTAGRPVRPRQPGCRSTTRPGGRPRSRRAIASPACRPARRVAAA